MGLKAMLFPLGFRKCLTKLSRVLTRFQFLKTQQLNSFFHTVSRLYKEIWRSYDSKTSLHVKLRLKNRPLSFATQLNENLPRVRGVKNLTS